MAWMGLLGHISVQRNATRSSLTYLGVQKFDHGQSWV